MTIAEMLADLPRHCSLGVKKSSKGHLSYWRGYKLHLDVADGQIPIPALLTGACLHDSQAAVPLITLASQRVTYWYDLMDAAYDARHNRGSQQISGTRSAHCAERCGRPHPHTPTGQFAGLFCKSVTRVQNKSPLAESAAWHDFFSTPLGPAFNLKS